jgi:CheY-like chemotaxis protein
MSAQRPKLLLVNGPACPAEEIARLLADRYEVVIVGADAEPTPEAATVEAVMCDASLLGQVSRIAGPSPELDSLSVLTALSEGVCVSGVDGTVLWANERFRAFDDQTRARISAVCRRAAQQFEDQMLAQEAAGFSGGRTNKFEVASPDESRFYEVVVSPIRARDTGRLERVAALVWEVTDSRRYQQKLDAIDRAGAELVRLDAEAVRKLHVADRLKLLEQKIVKFSHELLRFDHLMIRLIDERTGKLELVISSGLPAEAAEADLYAQREGNGIMGYVAATGRSYMCPDVEKDRRYVAGASGARSSLTVPLRLHDKVIGAFNIESEQLAAFTEEDRQFAEIFANHVALALHILDLLVVERCAAGESVTGTVEGELDEPLDDIMREADWFGKLAEASPELREHVQRIVADVQSIRRKIREAASGPQTILGAEKALSGIRVDPDLAGKHVLVADDEGKIREIIRDVLRGKGCRVVVCKDGGEAIAELISSQAAGEAGKFDLVISDIKMPDHNGYEVFSAARKAYPGIPVILMTGFGYDPHHSIVRASQDGLQCVLFKPFQIDRLIDEVKKALGASTPSGA